MMNNAQVLKSLCNAIANTFYPDDSTVELILFNEGIDPDGVAIPKDEKLFRVAVSLVFGYVEGSRKENGIDTTVLAKRIEESIKYWCNIYGLEADEVLEGYVRTIQDATKMW